MCPECGRPAHETVQVNASQEWHRCRNCDWDWWTETEEQIYAEP